MRKVLASPQPLLETDTLHYDLNHLDELAPLNQTAPHQFEIRIARILTFMLDFQNPSYENFTTVWGKEFMQQFNALSPIKIGERVDQTKTSPTLAIVNDTDLYPIGKKENTIIGEGSFGKVVLYTEPGYVTKKIYLLSPKPQKHGKYERTEVLHAVREANILRRLQNPQIPKLKEILLARNKQGTLTTYIIIEEIKGILLFDAIKDHYAFPQELSDTLLGKATTWAKVPTLTKLKLALQLLAVIYYLHEQGVIHADIKTDNLILSLSGIKLIDFGLSAHEMDAQTKCTPRGTTANLSPEAAKSRSAYNKALKSGSTFEPTEQVVSKENDIWGTAITIAEMLFSDHPFPGHHEGKILEAIQTTLPMTKIPHLDTDDHTAKTKFRALLSTMLHQIPTERGTAQDAHHKLQSVIRHYQPRPAIQRIPNPLFNWKEYHKQMAAEEAGESAFDAKFSKRPPETYTSKLGLRHRTTYAKRRENFFSV